MQKVCLDYFKYYINVRFVKIHGLAICYLFKNDFYNWHAVKGGSVYNKRR